MTETLGSTTEEPERLIGALPVTVKLEWGFERLRLFLTDSRIIVAHVGKRGTSGLGGVSLLGKFGAAIEDVFKSGKESRRKKKLEDSTPQEILAADPDNFEIKYDAVVSVMIEETSGLTKMTLLTTKDKLELHAAMQANELEGLLGPNLKAKTTSRKSSSNAKLDR